MAAIKEKLNMSLDDIIKSHKPQDKSKNKQKNSVKIEVKSQKNSRARQSNINLMRGVVQTGIIAPKSNGGNKGERLMNGSGKIQSARTGSRLPVQRPLSKLERGSALRKNLQERNREAFNANVVSNKKESLEITITNEHAPEIVKPILVLPTQMKRGQPPVRLNVSQSRSPQNNNTIAATTFNRPQRPQRHPSQTPFNTINEVISYNQSLPSTTASKFSNYAAAKTSRQIRKL